MLPEKIRASSYMIMFKFQSCILVKFFEGIRPEQVAHQAFGRGFSKSIYLHPFLVNAGVKRQNSNGKKHIHFLCLSEFLIRVKDRHVHTGIVHLPQLLMVDCRNMSSQCRRL